jgi:hypothetical protein
MKQTPSLQHLSLKLMLFPALCYAGLGAYDIFSDLIRHQLTIYQVCFNLLFFLPLFWHSRSAYKVFAWASLAFGSYLLLGLLLLGVKASDMSAALRDYCYVIGLASLLCLLFAVVYFKAAGALGHGRNHARIDV